jgi:hypothetical protein
VILVGRPEGNRPLGRPRRGWEDNIEMDLREIGIDGANWIRLAQDRVQWWDFVSSVMNLLMMMMMMMTTTTTLICFVYSSASFEFCLSDS